MEDLVKISFWAFRTSKRLRFRGVISRRVFKFWLDFTKFSVAFIVKSNDGLLGSAPHRFKAEINTLVLGSMDSSKSSTTMKLPAAL